MKNVALISLGCSKNLVDSENVLGYLKEMGYQIVNSLEESDIIIINTCGFIEVAKRESIDTIFEVLKYKDKKVVVIGCLVQRYLNELKKEIPEVEYWIPIEDYPSFNKFFQEVDSGNTLLTQEVDISKYRYLSSEVTSFIRIGEGCDNRCSFCAIPLIRGPFKSRPLEYIKEEANLLRERGIKEVVVLEQDTCGYGKDLKENLSIVDVLKVLNDIPEFKMIRLLYLYPDEITDQLLDYISTHPKVVPYFDIAIQHSEDHILKLMNRRGDQNSLRNLFCKIREKIPNSILRTTLMVGFPTETREDVKRMIEFTKEINFDHVGVFTYSREEDTPAYNMKKQVSAKEKAYRYNLVMKELKIMAKENNKKYVGKELTGLIVAKDESHYLIRTYINAPDDVDGKIEIRAKSGIEHNLGDEIKVKITSSTTYDLYGYEL